MGEGRLFVGEWEMKGWCVGDGRLFVGEWEREGCSKVSEGWVSE